MPVPATINDLSTTAGSNYPAGTESPTTIDDYFRSHASFIAQLRDGKVATTGNETIAGIKTFSSTIVGNISGSAASATTATTATNCANVAGGAAGSIPYQSGAGATSFVAGGTSGYLFQTNGSGAPTWVNPATLSVSYASTSGSASTANNVTGTVAIANGGTGQTTAAAAFSALKQDATTSATGVVELATNAEVQAGTDTARAITPSGMFSAFDKSLSANGYQKFPGGLIIQWGSASVAANSTGTISLPITFPTAFASLSVTHGSGGNAETYTSYGTLGGAWPLSTSQLAISNMDDVSITFYWMAIGY